MKRFIIAAAVAVAALSASAQQPATAAKAPAAPATDSKEPAVAVINGEVITQGQLNALYAQLNAQVRSQYDQNGGKAAFLENYLRKRLFIQEALKSGFDQKPDVKLAMDTAREGALFDRYVRDVVGSRFVSDADVRKYYDDHLSDYATPEQRQLWQLVLLTTGAQGMAKADAAQRIQEIAVKLQDSIAAAKVTDPEMLARVTLTFFKDAARANSQDPNTAPNGGAIGWVSQASLDTRFAAAAWATPKGSISPVVESAYGYHLIYVQDTRPAGVVPFDDVKKDIKERLLAEHTADIMNAVTQLTNELRSTGRVSVLPENIK